MTAILKVDTIQDTSGNNIINESSDTITIGASGDTIALAGTTVTGITQGITEADQWRLTANSNTGSNSDITSNWERNDGTGATYIGTGLTESSGIFSFPSTGKYLINAQFAAQMEANDTNVEVEFMVTTNNSSYTTVAYLLCGNGGGNNNTRNSLASSYILDVTDTSNVKFKFHTGSMAGSTTIVGDTNTQISGFTSIRLGDT